MPSSSFRRGLGVVAGFLQRHWRFIMLYEVVMITTSFILYVVFRTPPDQRVGTIAATHANSFLAPRAWGGFNERPLTETCYRQERTAILLAIILGTLGVDQWYAHHWILASFKLLTGLGLFPSLAILVSLGGDGSEACALCLVVLFGPAICLWAFIDVVLWVVGGVYGTPGCPGGGR
ncbi:hypothetical protein GGR51DRAFT_557958 [Nemania sp. FL0031]|nr:hypothetical protein GGR51DRAFT_557958 [Nemania sp. FL0031]